jgi:hypothetical protein
MGRAAPASAATPHSWPWKGFERVCPVCFKLDRGYDLYVGDKALLRLQEQYRTQGEELEQARSELTQLTDRYNRVRSKARKLMKAAVVSTVAPSRVEQLIRLCHPDKHDGSALATEVTQWLLGQRRKG